MKTNHQQKTSSVDSAILATPSKSAPSNSSLVSSKTTGLIAATGLLFSLTLLSGFVLSSTIVSADNDTVIDEVNITVPTACTMTGTGTDSHNATINPGTSDSAIGETTIKAFCNDSNGFAIYAIGYTDDTDGKNVLTSSTLGSNYDIATGTATSGNASNWAMKLSTISSPTPTYPIIIAGSSDDTTKEQGDPDYSTFQAVPDDYALVAKRIEGTDVGTGAEGSTLKTTYQAYIAQTQPAGTYTGQVKYTMVHPNDAARPIAPIITPAGYISYNPNTPDVTDTMGDQEMTMAKDWSSCNTYTDYSTMCIVDGQQIDIDTLPELDYYENPTLWASNFQRQGYGFAGWSDKPNWTLNENDANGNGIGSNSGYHIYGPNQTISDADILNTIKTNGLSLYAVWVPSRENFQSWSDCNTLNIGAVIALTDARDNDTYAVAKLNDGNCWMIENLRLNNTNSDNSTGVLAQGYATSSTYGDFHGLAEPETSDFYSATTANSLYYSGTQSGTASINIGTSSNPQYRFPRYNNQNTNSPVAIMTNTDANVYSYGNYYTWSAVTTDTSYSSGNRNTTSICPKGWRIATAAGSSGEYYILNNAQNSGATDTSLGLRTYPANYIYSGSFRDSSTSGRGITGRYWTSTVYRNDAYYLGIENMYAAPGTNSVLRYYGHTARCLFNS